MLHYMSLTENVYYTCPKLKNTIHIKDILVDVNRFTDINYDSSTDITRISNNALIGTGES